MVQMFSSITGVIYVPNKVVFSNRQSRGDETVEWRGFSAFEETELAVLNGSRTSNLYVEVLENSLLLYATSIHERTGYYSMKTSESILLGLKNMDLC